MSELPRKIKGAILTCGQLLLIPAIIGAYLYPPSVMWLIATIVLSYHFSVFGWILGQHRYFTHRQFKVSPLMEKWLMFWAVIGTWQSPIEWSNTHLQHHKHSDTEKDVHSVKNLGWKNFFFYFHKTDDLDLSMTSMRMIKSKWHLRALHFKYLIIYMYAYLMYLFFGPMGLLYGWIIPTAYSMLSQIVIVMSHKDGKPIDSFLIDLITLGEGNHKKHHETPRLYYADTLLKPVIRVIRHEKNRHTSGI